MRLRHLVLREIAYRRGNFLLGLLSVLVAVGCLVGALLALRIHDERTRERVSRLADHARRTTKELGFNVLILPADQDLGEFHANDYASSYMPEEYVTRLSESKIVTVNHLLPSLKRKLVWPEEKRTIIIIGTRGEVPIMHRDPKKPLLDAVAPGTVVLGWELHHPLGLEPGSRTTILGREFTVAKVHAERGTSDDITVWMNLAEAQELLGKKGQINAILALECHCAGDRISQIRSEISRILPDTRVIERASKAKARAEIRDKAAEEAVAARKEQESFAAILVPLVFVGASVWIGFLALGNVRDRAAEVGILRSLGLRAKDILCVFLGKAAVIGASGAVLGYLFGIVVGAVWAQIWSEIPMSATKASILFDPALFLGVLVAAPVVAMLSSWLPALQAARQDPAVILREN